MDDGLQRLVFVVDDEPAVAEILELFLVDAGFRVETFNNGQEALDFAQVHEPYAVISDIRMPRLDGISLARHIRQKYPHCKILLMSGDAITDTEFKVLQKPVSGKTLSIALAGKD